MKYKIEVEDDLEDIQFWLKTMVENTWWSFCNQFKSEKINCKEIFDKIKKEKDFFLKIHKRFFGKLLLLNNTYFYFQNISIYFRENEEISYYVTDYQINRSNSEQMIDKYKKMSIDDITKKGLKDLLDNIIVVNCDLHSALEYEKKKNEELQKHFYKLIIKKNNKVRKYFKNNYGEILG